MENSIHRCYVLDEQQEKFLRDKRYNINRMDCFLTLIERTVRVPTLVDISGHRQLELVQGQFMISDVELSALWGINRKTVSRLMKAMASLGMFTATKVAEVYVYSMHVLSAWIVDGTPVMNQFYHKPGKPGDKPSWKTPELNRIISKAQVPPSTEGTSSVDNGASSVEIMPRADSGDIPTNGLKPPSQTSTQEGENV